MFPMFLALLVDSLTLSHQYAYLYICVYLYVYIFMYIYESKIIIDMHFLPSMLF